MLKDPACFSTKDNHIEQKKCNTSFKTIRHTKASNDNTADLNASRIGLRDEAPSFTDAFTHLKYSTSLQSESDGYNHAKELTVSSLKRLSNDERSTWQVLKPNTALPSIHQRSSPVFSENDVKSYYQEIGHLPKSTMSYMAASMNNLPSKSFSSAFLSNSKWPCYDDSNLRSTFCSTNEGDQLQNNTRKRSIVESMNDRDSGSTLKNHRRKLSLVSPNLSKFSRPSDAAGTSPEFSIPLSAIYNSDYEGIDINRPGFSIMTDRPKDVLPSLQHLHVEASSFKVTDRVDEFVRLRKKTMPFLKN